MVDPDKQASTWKTSDDVNRMTAAGNNHAPAPPSDVNKENVNLVYLACSEAQCREDSSNNVNTTPMNEKL